MLTAAGVDAVFEPTSLYIRSGGCPLALCAINCLWYCSSARLQYLLLMAQMLQCAPPSVSICVAGEGNAASSDADVVVGAAPPEHNTGHETFVQVERLQQGLCGRSRPHFFRGVATVRRWAACHG